MARTNGMPLDSGTSLPSLTMDTVAHGKISVPDQFQGGWGALLIYRAHW